MKTKLSLLLLVLMNLVFAQTITFISENTNKPIPNVTVFGKDGKILAYSDIDGNIEKSLLTKDQENFQLIYENVSLATLPYSTFQSSIIKLNDRIKNIEPVTIKKGKGSKYILIKGNFTSYVTLNNKLNSYADGIVTYIFDTKNNKLKSTNVQQYRVYTLKNPENEQKKTDSWDYKSFLKIPDLDKAGNLEKYQTKNTVVKELKSNDSDQIQITGEAFQEKEFAFLGYRLYDLDALLNISFEKDSKKQLRDMLAFKTIGKLKLRHKSEPEYNQIIYYQNFYPTEIDFVDDKNIDEVKFNTNKSNFTTNYWEDVSFPNLHIIFSSYFRDDLQLK